MDEFSLKSALSAIKKRNAENPPEEIQAPRLDPDSPQERIARAKAFEQDILAQIKFLQGEPDSEVKTYRMNSALDRLGELAAEQGDYKRAALISKTPERREYYESIVKAIKIKDDKECECPDELMVDRKNQQEFRQPSMLKADRIMTEKGLLNLEICTQCGFKQVR